MTGSTIAMADFAMQKRVAFADTDMAAIAHYSSFLRYMEEAEHAFLRSRGMSAVVKDPKGYLGFPKVRAECAYSSPVRYDDVLEIEMHITTDGKSICYRCQFRHLERDVALGKLVTAFCRFPAGRDPYAVPIRNDVMSALFGEDQ